MKPSRSQIKAAGNFFGPIPDRPPGLFTVAVRLIICLVFIAGLNITVDAQSIVKINGHVYDAVDGHPIDRAEIKILGSDYFTFTDQFGYFTLENIPDGRYRIDITAQGYLTGPGEEVEVVADITRRLTIRLERKIHKLNDREVRGQTVPLEINSLEIIDRRRIEQSGNRSLAEVLNQLEGVYIHETGPAGGEKQVSIRGSASKHVLVLLDGQRLNPAGSGEADLNSVPLEMIEKVEVYRGGQSSRFGADALGGVINIITQGSRAKNKPEMKVDKYWGKWKTNLHHVTLINPVDIKRLTTKFTYGYRSTNSDFDYNYTVLPRHDNERIYTGRRNNADFESRNYFLSTVYRPGEKTSVSFSGQAYNSRQGLPGKASQPNSTARKEDDRLLGSLRLEHDLNPDHHLEMSLGFTRLRQEFDDKTGATPFESRHINDIAIWQTSVRSRLWTGNELNGGVSLQRDILYNDELLNPAQSMGRTVRDNIGLRISDRQTWDLVKLPFWDLAAVDISVRWDNTDTKKVIDDEDYVSHSSDWSQKIGASISRGEKTRIIIRGNYGTSYRLPSINALFWKTDIRSQGNPDLNPERSEHSDAGIEFVTEGWADISAGVTYFHSFVKDIIVWRPSSPLGIWTPANLDAALITGHEDFVRIGLFDKRLRLGYSNTITVPQNNVSGPVADNKYLTFRPHYVTSLECEMKFWKFRGAYNIRLVDIRYALEANTKWYGVYRIDDAALDFKTDISHVTIQAGYRVKNLHGNHYELIAHYPMPGREWGVDLSMNYRLD